MQRLTASLSASVHEATSLTLEHTLLYDNAVEVLQVLTWLLHAPMLPL